MNDAEVTRYSGRIGIDARHAILKLREHRLADPHTYLVELARAAAAAGAKTIRVVTQGRVLELSHDGRPPSREELGRLVQYIFDAGSDELHLRLLALSINGSLALEPASIELVAAAAAGSFSVAIDAEQLDSSDGVLEVRASTEQLDTASCRIRFVWPRLGRRPRDEVALLRSAARDSTIDVFIDDEAVEAPTALLRTSFDGGASRAFVEISPEPKLAEVAFLERGFRLVTLPWQLGALAPLERVLGLRAVFDAEELPTNVSRSKLQDSAELESRVTLAATAALERLLFAWAAELTDGACDPGVDNGLRSDERARRLLESAVAAVLTSTGSLDARLIQRFVELPLFVDATGASRRIADFAKLDVILVTRERQSAELHWLAERILLVQDRPIERILAGRQLVDASDILERGRIGLERRRRHLAHPEAKLELSGEAYVLSGAIADAEGAFAGLRAVYGLRGEAAASSGLRAAFHVEGRVLQAIAFGESEFPLPLDLAMTWPGKLVPSIDYDAVEMTPDVGEAIGRVGAEVLRRIEPLADSIAPELLRRAIALSVELEGVAVGAALSVPDTLHSAPIWGTTEPSRSVSLDDLAAYAAATGALCIAESGAVAPDHRPLLIADRIETRWLERLIRPREGLVVYPVLKCDRDAQIRAVQAAARAGGPPDAPGALVSVGDGCVAFACVARNGRVSWLHQGLTITTPEPTNAGVARAGKAPWWHEALSIATAEPSGNRVSLAVDDPTLVPSPDWSAARYHQKLSVSAAEVPLLQALLDALEDPAVRATLPAPDTESASLMRGFLWSQVRALEREVRAARETLARRERALEPAGKRQRAAAVLARDTAQAAVSHLEDLAARLARAEVFPVDVFPIDVGAHGIELATVSALRSRLDAGPPVVARLFSEQELAAPGTMVAWDALELALMRYLRPPMHAVAGRQTRPRPPTPRIAPAQAPPTKPAFTHPIVGAPVDCLASQVLDGVMRGRVWIPRQWQPAPSIAFRHKDQSVRLTLRTLSTSPIDPVVPLQGEIEVQRSLHDEPYRLEAAVRMMRVAVDLARARDEVELSWRPYVWHLALLEQLAAPKLRVTALDGRRVGARAVREQLQKHRRVWLGRDPSQLKRVGRELCLLDTPSPLLAILDTDPSLGLVRRLGVDMAFGASIEAWMQRAVSSLWQGSHDTPDSAASALCAALHHALVELRLSGDPVEHVVVAGTGRPVRYRALTRQLVLNTASPLVRVILAEPGNASHLDALVVAAVSEINRALSGVTDAEERRALLTRLYALPDPE